MKKLLYIAIFMLCTILMVACDGSKKSFELVIDDYRELRESIFFDLTLKDDNDQLKNSEIKGEITKKGSKTVISTKDVTFSKEDKTAKEVAFKNLTAETEYTVTFYAGYNGKKEVLHTGDYKTKAEGGNTETPYLIKTIADLKDMKKDPKGHFKLDNDIDCADEGFAPLFSNGTPFAGTFNGNGKKISNFTLAVKNSDTNTLTHSSQSSQYLGLFGYIGEEGSVYNLTLDSFNVMVKRTNTKETYIGLLAGYCAGTIKDITVVNSKLDVLSEETTKDRLTVGGLVGKLAKKGTITNVTMKPGETEPKKLEIIVSSKINATVGGVVGTTADAERFTKVENDKNVLAANISNVTFEGNITVNVSNLDANKGNAGDSQTTVAGVVGRNYSAFIDACSSKGKISLTSDFTKVGDQGLVVAGVVGRNLSDDSRIANCTSSSEFYLNTLDVPAKVAEGSSTTQKYLNIHVGLLVGINNGAVSKLNYVKLDTAAYEIHVNKSGITGETEDAKFVKINVGLIAENNSQYALENKTDKDVEFNIYSYTVGTETVVDPEPGKLTIKAE